MEAAEKKAMSFFNEIKTADFDFQNEVIARLNSLALADRLEKYRVHAADQAKIIESLVKLNLIPSQPEEPAAVQDIVIVKSRPSEQASNETTSDPS